MAYYNEETPQQMEGKCDFNFGVWIDENELEQIKPIFVRHKMVTNQSLCLMSYGLHCLAQEIEQSHNDKPLLIERFWNAIKELQTSNANDMNAHHIAHGRGRSVVVVVVSDQENQIIQSMNANKQKLDELETDLALLTTEYMRCQTKKGASINQQIEIAKMKAHKMRDDLHSFLFENVGVAVTKELDELRTDIDSKESDLNGEDNDDEKQNYKFNECMAELRKQRGFLSADLAQCNDMIHESEASNNNDIKVNNLREKQIIKIGNNAQNKFKIVQMNMQNNIAEMRQIIDEITPNVTVDFVVDQKKYKQLQECLNTVGKVRHASNNKPVRLQRNNKLEEQKHNEPELMKYQRRKVKKDRNGKKKGRNKHYKSTKSRSIFENVWGKKSDKHNGGKVVQIFIKPWDTTMDDITLELSLKCLISDVKTLIIKELGFQKMKQTWRLAYNGKKITDENKTLAYYNIVKESTLYCLVDRV